MESRTKNRRSKIEDCFSTVDPRSSILYLNNLQLPGERRVATSIHSGLAGRAEPDGLRVAPYPWHSNRDAGRAGADERANAAARRDTATASDECANPAAGGDAATATDRRAYTATASNRGAARTDECANTAAGRN